MSSAPSGVLGLLGGQAARDPGVTSPGFLPQQCELEQKVLLVKVTPYRLPKKTTIKL